MVPNHAHQESMLRFPKFLSLRWSLLSFLVPDFVVSLDTNLSLRQSFPSLCWSLGRLLDGSSGLLHELQRPRNPIAGSYEPNRRSCWAVFSFDGSSATIACCMNCTVPVTSSPPASHTPQRSRRSTNLILNLWIIVLRSLKLQISKFLQESRSKCESLGMLIN